MCCNNKTLRANPKNSYVICGINNDGEKEIIVPMKKPEHIFGFGHGRSAEDYMYDLADVKNYIKENLMNKFKSIYITKIIEGIHISMNSMYEGK